MTKILAVGIATIDIINSVAKYPAEDDEVRVTSQRKFRGGNATNTLVVLSQLGIECHWAGVLIDEPDANIVKHSLDMHQINYQSCVQLANGKMPTSYITLSEETGSRTIVHHRDCPEYNFENFQEIELADYDWIHFEGRNISELHKMLTWLKAHHPEIACSLEVEKPRDGIEELFDLPDIVFFSKQYANAMGFHCAAEFLCHISTRAISTCAWGVEGAWLKLSQHIIHQPAFLPSKVIDTLGAGDTFNAGMISSLANQKSPEEAIAFASQLSGRKCGQLGFEHLIDLTR